MLNARIPWQRSYKYLGVTLDRNLNFRDHIARVRKTALFYTARLGALLGRKSKLSRRNKGTIYKMCIRTVMTYASPVFAHAASKTLERLQVIDLSFPTPSARPPQTAPGRTGRTEPYRDGSQCRPAALGEAIEVVRPVARLVAWLYSTADPLLHLQGDFFSGFQPHTIHAYGREGVQ
ncbi:RNA-directed DNA polymerase from mobile element jockey [Eumeta japonica]|uniref:RNA-directed DNA polymerase from mobile element jockey n=1 Tax=Eumeta variegata TaxID=151549 RepID=A0A4C1XX16_EUMVA|nr:RNA-directed DNA polymerase from mobile element jockey [Eumeta japonica]